MKKYSWALAAMALAAVAGVTAQMPAGGAVPQSGGAAEKWPYAFPARIQDGENKDLLVMTLGRVESPLAQGTFDPVKDEYRSRDGAVTKNYYREKLGVKYYAPLDKTQFALPPSGWCSWYYYYQEINENEVKRNAAWIAEHLRDYGAEYVQIDDGWQGEGRGRTRDWSTVDKRFPGGMDGLAAYIRSLGLKPGIWLAPHGQSNEAVVKSHPNVFLLKEDGTTASDTWEGRWLVDPSTPESHAYLSALFARLSNWGYEYFKIDGQPIVINEYRQKKSFMKNPAEDTDGLYRKTLETIRQAIGPQRYLLGCWGTPLAGAGIMNGSRTGGDVVLGWDGFRVALRATLLSLYLHNIVWYADPDVMVARAPMTADQARAWATLQGLTGQAMLTSDRLMDLSEERVEILRRVYPAADIRPMDLFPAEANKRIWDLKVNHLGRQYDVVGVFNYDETKPEKILLRWKDLGLPEDRPMHVFDFWGQEYLGAWEKGYTAEVAPTAVRVLTLAPASDHPQLVSTSRHITQGWLELKAQSYDAQTSTYRGTSQLVRNDRYRLWFAFPRGKNLAVKRATARTARGTLPVKIWNHQGWAEVAFTSPQNAEARWEVVFETAEAYNYPTQAPANVRVELAGGDAMNLRWDAQYYSNAGYQVYVNGELAGYTPSNSFPLRGLKPESAYRVEVRSVWENGAASERAGALRSALPGEVLLSELEPARPGGLRGFGRNRSAAQRLLSIAGAQHETGIGARGDSEIEFDLKGLFPVLEFSAGVDDATQDAQASVEFIVLGDGKVIWRSGAMKKSAAAKGAWVNVEGVERLVLRVTGGGEARRVLADWAGAKVLKAPAH